MTRRRSMVSLCQGARKAHAGCVLFAVCFLVQIVAPNTSAQQPKRSDTGGIRQGRKTPPASSAQGKQRSGDQARAGGTRRATGSITGRVLAEGGHPLLSATVYANALGAGGSLSRRTGTDADGKFRIDGLAPGAYRVAAHAPGYVMNLDAMRGLGETAYHRPGDTVNLSLTKGGVITGTVTDSNGEPVVAITVRAIRVRDRQGHLTSDSAQGVDMRLTDDRGVYRLYGLEAGAYIVAAGGRDPYYGGSLYENEARTYYPSATRDTATEVTVTSGQEMSAIDIRYRGEPGHTVSGTFSGEFGTDSNPSSVAILLAQIPGGAFESSIYVSPWENTRAFALRGVPDGNYYIVARHRFGENAASSPPRRITVKGADVTGLELALVPLGSITGRLVLEATLEASPEHQTECRKRPGASLEEVIVNARRDEPVTDKDKLPWVSSLSREGITDEQGNFELRNLAAGHYRFRTSLLGDDWYVRAVTLPTTTTTTTMAGNQPVDVTRNGLALKIGERARGLTITVAGGASKLRGRVNVTVEGGRTQPARLLRVHLVPAEQENAESVLRFAEVAVLDDGTFAFSNIAPGRYWLIARPVADKDSAETVTRPVAWDSEGRARLRREAERMNTTLDLQPCQFIADYVLRYR